MDNIDKSKKMIKLSDMLATMECLYGDIGVTVEIAEKIIEDFLSGKITEKEAIEKLQHIIMFDKANLERHYPEFMNDLTKLEDELEKSLENDINKQLKILKLPKLNIDKKKHKIRKS
jgi:hypothetical protein